MCKHTHTYMHKHIYVYMEPKSDKILGSLAILMNVTKVLIYIGVPGLSLMFGCEYLSLCWSGVDRTFQGTAILSSYWQVLFGTRNSEGGVGSVDGMNL